MRKTPLLLLLFSLSLSVYGQQENLDETGPEILKNDILICYGIGTSNLITNFFDELNNSLFSSGDYDFRNKKYTHSILFIYKNSVLTRLNLGLTFGFERISKDVYLDDDFR